MCLAESRKCKHITVRVETVLLTAAVVLVSKRQRVAEVKFDAFLYSGIGGSLWVTKAAVAVAQSQ